MKFLVLGVGNSLHSDDGAGPAVVEVLQGLSPAICAFDCGTAPENFTGVVRRMRPDLLLIVDAAEMGLGPGSVRRIPGERIHDTTIGTHMMALKHVIRFLSDTVPDIVVIGIQPAFLEEGETLTPEVDEAVLETAAVIATEDLERIPVLKAGER